MTESIFNSRMIAPRQTPGPLFSDPALSSLGDPFKNFSQNHQPFTPSPTNEFEVQPVQIQPAAENHQTVTMVQPGEYHPGYCEEMIRWFDRPKTKKIYDSYTWKSGAVSEKERFVPNTPPHFSEFARSIGVTTRILKKWCREHDEFRQAYEVCQEIFEEFLIDNGLLGSYGAIAMKFVAVNRSKMKDKQVHENQTVDLNKVLDAIADGKVKPGGHMELPGEEEY